MGAHLILSYVNHVGIYTALHSVIPDFFLTKCMFCRFLGIEKKK